jgi:transcriptional regulator with XRE-family HTH domain
VLVAVPKKQANPIDAHVGNRMRLRRMLIGLSQERMGEMLGLTFQQVQKYEKGVNRIGAGRLYQIADILSVPVAYFYEGFVGDGANPHAANDDTATKPVMEFLSSGEGLQLTLAFMRIKDGKVRKRVIDLIKSLSDGVEPPAVTPTTTTP